MEYLKRSCTVRQAWCYHVVMTSFMLNVLFIFTWLYGNLCPSTQISRHAALLLIGGSCVIWGCTFLNEDITLYYLFTWYWYITGHKYDYRQKWTLGKPLSVNSCGELAACQPVRWIMHLFSFRKSRGSLDIGIDVKTSRSSLSVVCKCWMSL